MESTGIALVGLGLVLITSPFCRLSFSQDYFDVEKEIDLAASSQVSESGSRESSDPEIISQSDHDRDHVRYISNPDSSGNLNVQLEDILEVETSGNNNIGDLLTKLQLLQEEVMRLNGIVEQQSYDIRVLKDQSLERYIELDRRINTNVAYGADVSIEQLETDSFPESTLIPAQSGETETYRSAYNLVKNKKFEEAINGFREFLNIFPDGKFAANAHYWLGELHLVLDTPDPEAGRQSFVLLITQFPDHSKIPVALYKLGKIQLMKGDREKSKYYLNRVISDYGDTKKSVAKLAQDFIDENGL